MRVPASILALGFAVLAVAMSPSEAWAEKKVKTNQETNLLSRPGERGKVLLTVDEGKSMTVLVTDGRWLKVRVKGRTGWVPRSKVDISDVIARNTRRRSFVDGRGTSRGFKGEEGPKDRVGGDAVGEGVETTDDPEEGEPPKGPKSGGGKPRKDPDEEDADTVVIDEDEVEAAEAADERPTARVKAKTVALAEPDPDAEESFNATPKMVLYPGSKKGKYTEVENDDGELGYILTSSLSVDEPAAAGGPRRRQLDGRARLGVTFVSQSSAPSGGKVSTSAATLALGGGMLMPYGKKYVVGGELTYDYAKAYPGVQNEGGGNTSIGIHNLRLRALGGLDMKKKSGMTLFGRLGFHFQSFQVSAVEDLTKNSSKLPSEIIKMPALGVGLALPRLTKKIGVRASLDLIPFASVKQTVNLEDGGDPGARGALLEAGMTYRWKKTMDISVTYDLTYLSMSFGAPLPSSKRPAPMMGNVSRGDQFHSFTVGVARAF
jgi:uncharacterized protein YgiM (DUF1202 family)